MDSKEPETNSKKGPTLDLPGKGSILDLPTKQLVTSSSKPTDEEGRGLGAAINERAANVGFEIDVEDVDDS